MKIPKIELETDKKNSTKMRLIKLLMYMAISLIVVKLYEFLPEYFQFRKDNPLWLLPSVIILGFPIAKYMECLGGFIFKKKNYLAFFVYFMMIFFTFIICIAQWIQ